MPTNAPAATLDAPPTKPAGPQPKPQAPDGLIENQGGDSPYSDAMAELEEFNAPAAERKKPQPKPAAQPKKPEAPKEPEPKAEVKDPEPEPEKKPEEPKPQKAAELRTAYEKAKQTIKDHEAEIARLKSEKNGSAGVNELSDANKVLAEKLEAADKRNAELEKEITFVNYQKSKEYKDKYEAPLVEAWERAQADLNELTVEDEEGNSRKATENDLLALAQMPLKEAWAKAKGMFGDAASEIMDHRRRVIDLMQAQNKALKEAQTNSEARNKEQQALHLQQREKLGKLWQDENKAWADKFPKWFQPEDGDEKGNALLAKGYELASSAFSTNGGKTPEEMVKIRAEVRNKAAAFPKLAYKLKQARDRIKELEKTVSEYEASEPPAGEGGKPRAETNGTGFEDAMAELDRLK